MYPGHVTTVHSHDDDDECLSGVYYVTAPENSGNLILHTEEGLFTLPPRAGRFVFFPPEMPHEVSENQGTEFRLSVGMNFGPLSD
jgi:oxalate decarboxylase/phosphoglucose isomerase-like protein (cupin superfamily)